MAESPSSSADTLYVEQPPPVPVDQAAEESHARKIADRYELEFVDLVHFHVDHALFRSIPADLMLRYGFVPYRREGQTPGCGLNGDNPPSHDARFASCFGGQADAVKAPE